MNEPFPSTAPDEIVFLPEGEHRIHAHTSGKPRHSTVRVMASNGAAIAAKLQRDLTRRQSHNVRPWVDFEHKAGAASALPKSFRYEAGKGVMLALEWTDAGRRAVEGKDFSYFSPVFYLGEDGVPEGLPEKGAIGALVNEPAFREIPRIAAGDASRGFVERARELVAAGDVPEIHEGCAAVFAADPQAYRDYLAGLREGTGPALVEADEFAESGGELVKAIVERIGRRGQELVDCGDARDLDEGIVMAMERNPALYQRLLEAQEDDPGEPASSRGVRPSVMREIEQMGKEREPAPKSILDEIAEELLAKGEADSPDEAQIKAIEQRPDLYQEWLDNGARMLGVKTA